MATVTWIGLEAFNVDMRRLANDMVNESRRIVMRYGHGSAAEIRAAYKIGPDAGGHLRDTVVATDVPQAFGHMVKVKNTAIYAGAYEGGRKKGIGKDGRNRGTHPGNPTFGPIRDRNQRDMVDALKALMRQHGLEVTGEADR